MLYIAQKLNILGPFECVILPTLVFYVQDTFKCFHCVYHYLIFDLAKTLFWTVTSLLLMDEIKQHLGKPCNLNSGIFTISTGAGVLPATVVSSLTTHTIYSISRVPVKQYGQRWWATNPILSCQKKALKDASMHCKDAWHTRVNRMSLLKGIQRLHSGNLT